MNFLMSINNLTNLAEPRVFKRILDVLDENGVVDGFEINGDFELEYERKYMREMVKIYGNEGKVIQLHTPFDFNKRYGDVEYLEKGLAFYHELSQLMKKPLMIVVHPIENLKVEDAIRETIAFHSLLSAIIEDNGYNVEFAFENLNRSSRSDRLNTYQVKEVIDITGGNFCWDIGHDVFEDKLDYSLDQSLLSKLVDIHIHDVDEKDHMPFDYGRTDYGTALRYLDEMEYTGSVVVELNFQMLKSQVFSGKIMEYIANIKKLKKCRKDISNERERQIV